MQLEAKIIALIEEQAEQSGVELVEMKRDVVLLESGLDSIHFATLVVVLEQELGVDPFTETDEVIYPETLGEFVDLYEASIARKKAS